MSEIDFIPFATGAGANVITQATYASGNLSQGQTVADGFQGGTIAESEEANKIWRQSSFISAVLATFVSNTLNVDVLDDGNVAGLVTNLTAAVRAISTKLFNNTIDISVTYAAMPSESGTLYISAAGNGTVALPDTSTIPVGWFAGFIQESGTITAEVNGSHSERILIPTFGAVTGVTTFNASFEFFVLNFDGNNFDIISASPNTWQNLGASAFYSSANPPPSVIPGASPLLGSNGTSFIDVAVGAGLSLSGGTLSANAASGYNGEPFGESGTFVVPAIKVKCTMVGAGGGGNVGGGGGAGAGVVVYLSGLTVGETISVTVGIAGVAGANGGDTFISSGTQSISTSTAGGGGAGSGSLGSGGVGGIPSGFINGLSSEGIAGTPSGEVIGGSFTYGTGAVNGLLGSYGSGGLGEGLYAAQPGFPGYVLFEWIG